MVVVLRGLYNSLLLLSPPRAQKSHQNSAPVRTDGQPNVRKRSSGHQGSMLPCTDGRPINLKIPGNTRHSEIIGECTMSSKLARKFLC